MHWILPVAPFNECHFQPRSRARKLRNNGECGEADLPDLEPGFGKVLLAKRLFLQRNDGPKFQTF
jgi:hypothetical protein